MPRVHTQKAGKDYPEIGVKKGEVYHWWKFRYGGKRKSKSYPRPSQLTQSKMSGAYAAQEGLEDAIDDSTIGKDELADECDNCASELESVRDEYQDSLDSMPDGTQDASPVGEQIQEKIDGLDEWIDNLNQAAGDIRDLEPEEVDEDDVDEDNDLETLQAEAEETMMEEARDLARQAAECPF